MRILAILLIGLSIQLASFAQGTWKENIKWRFSVEKIDSNHAYIVGKAKLYNHFHIFSVNHEPEKADFTGTPTTFSFIANKNYKCIGKLKDGSVPEKFVDELGTQLYFQEAATFKQKIEILSNDAFDIEFTYSFQICDASGCIFPPAQDAFVSIKGYTNAVASNATTAVTTPSDKDTVKASQNDENGTQIQTKKPSTDKQSSSLWWTFVAGFGGGLLALLTPCMFPMIPMTVTFFTKQSKTRTQGIIKALVYGASIVIIYVTSGILFTAVLGTTGLNDLATNIWMNLVFFTIFMVFAFSFLGAFEIQLPSSWVNKMDKQADRGGYIGVFFMAFTLGLVSFSCTGPIIGSLLVTASTTGSYLTPAIGMGGFALALAIPFTLFAIFPSWLNSLPQSGGWLNSVKVVLGLLEIALALKFLSAVDMAYHWDLLTREWFVGTWFVLFFVMGIYLLGKIRFSHDSPVEKLSVPRFMFALVALVFAVYLFPGMFGHPLKLIDGIAPPRTHSEDNFRFNNGGLETGIVQDSISEKYNADMHPVGDGSIMVFHDLVKGRAYAKERNLPILLDFTGHACQNCRKTESSIWTNDEIRPLLQKNFVVISLYVDDHQALPKSEQRYSHALEGKIRDIGNKWAEYEVEHYKSFQQPLYVVTDVNGNDLTEAIGYTPSVETYKAFLTKGIRNFNK
ncbi:MAG: cytochrome c biogenesis protein CcdA [Flavobacteriia bacterium]